MDFTSTLRFMEQRRTATQLLADELLGMAVEDWIAERRTLKTGRAERSWRLIADELRKATNDRVFVTPEALRLWCVGPETEAA